jgi:hypothetical protein
MLEQILEGQNDRISSRIGADPTATRGAVQAAIPALLAALSGEARTERADGLRAALERDHDGAILDQLTDYLDGTSQLSPRTTNGTGILEHVLGDDQQDMARALSARSGIDLGSMGNLLALLAPILMGMLGKQGRSSGGGGISLPDLGGILGRETESARSRNPDLGDILDKFGSGTRGGGTGRGSDTGSGTGSSSANRSRGRSGGGLMDWLGDLLRGKDR